MDPRTAGTAESLGAVTPESALVAGVLYRVHSVDVQAFRCGKIATTVVLRDGDTEIVVTTAGDWKKVLGGRRDFD